MQNPCHVPSVGFTAEASQCLLALTVVTIDFQFSMALAQSSHDESHFRDEGNVVRARVFSQSADAWVSGEVTQFFEDNFVRIEYKVGDYWHRKTLHLFSEQPDIPSAERHTLM